MSGTKKSLANAVADSRFDGLRSDWTLEAMLAKLTELSAKLRETAAGLDDKTIHPAHAANRLRKMARGIDGGK